MSFGLNTARAIVVDDDYDEIENVIKALARLGIGSVWLTGQLEDTETLKFSGIRLAFLDMNLTGDASMDSEDHAEYAAKYLSEVLDEENGVLCVFIWTKNEDAAKYFERAFSKYCPNIFFIILGVMEKPKDDKDFSKDIIARIEEEFSDKLGIKLLWEWEQLTHDAATQTTASVTQIAKQSSLETNSTAAEIPTVLVTIFAALALAVRERQAEGASDAASDFISALAPILQDRAEHLRARATDVVEDHWNHFHERIQEEEKIRVIDRKHKRMGHQYGEAKAIIRKSTLENIDIWSGDPRVQVIELGAKRNAILDELKLVTDIDGKTGSERLFARLNRMMHVSLHPGAGIPLLPGYVYLINKQEKAADLVSETIGLPLTDFLKDTIQVAGNDIRPIVIEISPVCDYANNKCGAPRFLLGCLAPRKYEKRVLRNSHYIWEQCGPIYFEKDAVDGIQEGQYLLVLNARYQITLPLSTICAWNAALRVRHNTLVDIQAWLARYGNRPGIISVT